MNSDIKRIDTFVTFGINASAKVMRSCRWTCLLFIWHVCLRVSTLTKTTAIKLDYVFSARRATETKKSRLKLLGVNRITTLMLDTRKISSSSDHGFGECILVHQMLWMSSFCDSELVLNSWDRSRSNIRNVTALFQ